MKSIYSAILAQIYEISGLAMKVLIVPVYIVLTVMIAYQGIVFYVDYQLDRQTFDDAYDDCNKIWSARGLYDDPVEQNSIQSISRAFNQGAPGVEVDVYFDTSLAQLIVSHDYPYNLKNGKLLPLGELLEAIGKDHFFWLDFKNLRDLSEREVAQVVKYLHTIIQPLGLKGNIYIEGSDPINLSKFRDAGFKTMFDTFPAPDGHMLSSFMINVYKIFYYFGEFTVMSMNYARKEGPIYVGDTIKQLGNIPLFIYHIPVDEALIDELVANSRVRILLIGNNQSVDFHYKNACSGESKSG